MRQAFTADLSKGHHLVVADYGQLELRLLAHMTDCRSMLEAFKAGGDFHSRTALGMYDHIKEAIDRGALCHRSQSRAALQFMVSKLNATDPVHSQLLWLMFWRLHLLFSVVKCIK